MLDARARLVEKLESDPGNPKAPLWLTKIAEYEKSLSNFEQFGQEDHPTGNKVSVNIDVPAGKFTVESHEPGV